MRVLVTGYLGYVGPAVVAAFQNAGHHVIGFDNGYFEDCVDPLEPQPVPDGDIRRDVRDVGPGDVTDVDAIVHLAGLSNDPLGELAPALTPDINHAATLRLAALAKAAGCPRFVFASSCSLYGAAADCASPLEETAPLRPVSAYAQSKAACERDLGALADDRFSPVFLRFATAFGASPRMRFDLVLNNLVAWARTTGEIRVLSDGTPWRPLVHIKDMAQAMLRAATAPRDIVHARPFNIGRDDNNLTVADLARLVQNQVPGTHIAITGENGSDPRSYRVDFRRAHRELPDFRPEWTVEMGCEEVDRWIRARELTADDFQSHRFIRLKHLQFLQEQGRVGADLRLCAAPALAGAPR
ncbi:SDR family oxidoreductase [Azospirillum cavernae]|uniref:SDR family oxidoreductase n=1 Tax=Azospirillum cavernae TaxID=2320860 RepID=A0A418VL29_9PROT|nr:SDR family oxidoreductase [Azospirillum cavernae]RJF76863.1 SDR family oxidoreductase [Azospirillum cavernae]